MPLHRFALPTFALLLSGTALPVLAQTAPAPEAEPGPGIVVTGYRTANQAQIQAKRDATGIVDTASQDQVGLLPDNTIGQVAQRIAGVSLVPSFTGANDRSEDSSENVVIRGISSDDNLVTFDGVPLASTSQTQRGARIELIPPSGIARIEAIKTLTAAQDAQALSGHLNLVTASAIAHPGFRGQVSSFIGYNETEGAFNAKQGPDRRADAALSKTFDDFGLMVAGSYAKTYSTNYDTKPGVETDTYIFYVANPATSTSQTTDISKSNGFPASRRNQIFAFQDERERYSGIAKLEYAPSDATYAALTYGYFHQDELEDRQEYLALGDTATRPANQAVSGGLWTRGRIEYGYTYQPEHRNTQLAIATLRQALGPKAVLNTHASWSQAKVDTPRSMSKFRPSAFTAGDAFTYDLSSGRPVLDFANPSSVNDLTRYQNNYIRAIRLQSRQDVAYVDADLGFNFAADDMGFGADIGGAFTRSRQSFDKDQIEGTVSVGGKLVTMDQYVLPNPLPSSDPDSPFFLIDDAKLRALWVSQGMPQSSDTSATSIQDDYRLQENIAAGFGQARWRSDSVTILAGLRYENADVTVNGWGKDSRIKKVGTNASQYVRTVRNSGYDYFLPSIIGRFALTQNLVGRLGYGRTLGRPDFSDYAAGESIGTPDVGNKTVSIDRGNPDLKPRTSDNFDASLEYYFDGGRSMVSLAGFAKHIRDLIYVQDTVIDNYDLDGVAYRATVTQPMNANNASLYGFELSMRKDFANTLPAPFDGFIAEGNLSYIKGDVSVVSADGVKRDVGGFEKQPSWLGNFALSYEKGPFAFKAAYSYVSDYIASINEDGALWDIFTKARSQVDLQGRLSLGSLQLVAQVKNLTGANLEKERRFPFGTLLGEDSQRGRIYSFGLRYRFGKR